MMLLKDLREQQTIKIIDMKIIVSIILWLVVARVMLWLGKFIWPEDNGDDDFHNLRYQYEF